MMFFKVLCQLKQRTQFAIITDTINKCRVILFKCRVILFASFLSAFFFMILERTGPAKANAQAARCTGGDVIEVRVNRC